MTAVDPFSGERFPLNEQHRMLLRIRDTLYEGSWDDFEHDLRSRAEGRPHVFETVPTSPEMLATIDLHLVMINRMRHWEFNHDLVLSPDDAS